MERRTFLKYCSFGFGAGLAYYLANKAMTTDNIVLEEKNLYFKNLPKKFIGYKIGFLSDIHIGPYVPVSWVDKAVKLLDKAEPDILLLGGDYISMPESIISQILGYTRNSEAKTNRNKKNYRALFNTAAKSLSQIKPKDGVHAVYGNHDRWLSGKICKEVFEEFNINLLVNSSIELTKEDEKILIYGTDDHWTGIPSIKNLGYRKSSRDFRIILSHNPDFISEILYRSFNDFDLALCGHTHGGQIKLPLFGAPMYNVNDSRFQEGLYTDGFVKVYTSRGLGVVEIPYRVNCPPEVTLITLGRY